MKNVASNIIILTGVMIMIVAASGVLSLSTIPTLPKTDSFITTRNNQFLATVTSGLTASKAQGVDLTTATTAALTTLKNYMSQDFPTIAQDVSTDCNVGRKIAVTNPSWTGDTYYFTIQEYEWVVLNPAVSEWMPTQNERFGYRALIPIDATYTLSDQNVYLGYMKNFEGTCYDIVMGKAIDTNPPPTSPPTSITSTATGTTTKITTTTTITTTSTTTSISTTTVPTTTTQTTTTTFTVSGGTTTMTVTTTATTTTTIIIQYGDLKQPSNGNFVLAGIGAIVTGSGFYKKKKDTGTWI